MFAKPGCTISLVPNNMFWFSKKVGDADFSKILPWLFLVAANKHFEERKALHLLFTSIRFVHGFLICLWMQFVVCKIFLICQSDEQLCRLISSQLLNLWLTPSAQKHQTIEKCIWLIPEGGIFLPAMVMVPRPICVWLLSLLEKTNDFIGLLLRSVAWPSWNQYCMLFVPDGTNLQL